MADFINRAISWELPFEKGSLRAVAKNNGKQVAEYELKTTGSPSLIAASCDKETLKAGTNDLAHVFVTICDKEGNTVYNAENEISCTIEGPVRLLGMEDSNPSNIEDYKDNKQNAYHGKLLIYLQSLDNAGRAKIILTSSGLEIASIFINVTE